MHDGPGEIVAGESSSAIDLDNLLEASADFSGDLLRKVSRMQAIKGSHPLTVWQKEWCVVSHNFLVFFATHVDLAVRRCVLLSSIRSVGRDADGRTFRLALESAPDLSLRVPDSARTGAGLWVAEIQRRMAVIASCSSGREAILPCVSLTEARQLAHDLSEELSEEAAQRLRQVERQTSLLRHKALLSAISAVVNCRLHIQLRQAFDELAMNSRLKRVSRLHQRVALQRLSSALGRPLRRRVEAAWEILQGPRNKRSHQLESILRSERERVRLKSVKLGVALLGALLRDKSQAQKHYALLLLRESGGQAVDC